jgi:16S rRNA (uracil1498-N3)-methyltransferase
MKHVPHVVVGAPWDGAELPLSVLQWRHLTRVLRMKRGKTLTYTDGLGTLGEGALSDHSITRGSEREVPRGIDLKVAVAPPSNKDRQRYLVEKLAELGVSRLQWMDSDHGAGRISNPTKVFSWTLAALEQSRGAWVMETSPDLVKWNDLEGPTIVCSPGGGELSFQPRTVVIGPEGGFSDDEIPEMVAKWDLGPNILRVETAAVVAAARILG